MFVISVAIILLACASANEFYEGVYIPPAILLSCTFIFQFRVKLAEGQKPLFRQLAEALRCINVRHIEIDDEGYYLNRNVDGSFDRRSKFARKLNKEIEQLRHEESHLRNKADELRYKVVYLTACSFAFKLSALAYFCELITTSSKGGFDVPGVGHLVTKDLHSAMVFTGLSSAPILIIAKRLSAFWLDRYWVSANWWGVSCEKPTDHQEERSRYDWNDDEDAESQERDAQTDEENRRSGKESWYEVLGVAFNASVEEINAAFKEKMKRNHPDRVADLDQEFQNLANERTKRLNWARAEGLKDSRK
jgi:hypothetical protein